MAVTTGVWAAADKVPEGLAKSDWTSIRAAYEAGRHAFQPVEGGWQARNPGQQWTTRFDGSGFLATPRDGGWTWGLELKSYGRGTQQTQVSGKPAVKAEGPRLSYQWDAAVQEWWVNDPRGLEHGYVIHSRPAGDTTEALSFLLGTRGSLLPKVRADTKGVEFCDAAGTTVLNYAGLKVWDADGKVLPSRFEAAGEKSVRLLVEEHGARYPLTIDPIAQQAYLKASNAEASDFFGYSVAVSGDTVVVGAPWEDSNATGVNGNMFSYSAGESGAAYIFTRSGTTWTQQAYLKASNTGAGDKFGQAVAVSGDTVVIGAPYEYSNATGVNGNEADNSAQWSGAAYVFSRSGTVWTHQAYLKASNTDAFDSFGSTVAVSGDTVIVGAHNEASNATGVNGSQVNNSASGSGAGYIFTRNGSTWTQQAYLKASNTGADDRFGYSVAVSDNTVVVGAFDEDSDVVGVNGSGADNSAANSGAAYVFTRSGTTWSQQAFLKASNTGGSDQFGFSVAVSGDTVVVGANQEGSSATGVDGNQFNNTAFGSGAAYVFTRNGTIWTQQAYLKASNSGANDLFGGSVAVSGEIMVVGAYNESSNATGINGNQADNSASNSGSAYVFTRSGTTWTQQVYLKASNSGANDLFGFSVGISGHTVISGAYNEASNAMGVNGNQADNSAGGSGAAYISFLAPYIVLEQPMGTNLANGGTKGFAAIVGSTSELTITIKNTGGADLTLSGTPKVAVSGTDAGMFTIIAQPDSPVSGPSGSTSFTVRFSPASAGVKTAALSISNNDNDKNPFGINLSGTGLTSNNDSDGDGMNDASEFQMSALGFDWQVNQVGLVNTLTSNLNGVGYFTPTQVQALNVGAPLIQRNSTTGVFTLTIGVEKSNTLAPGSFLPFSMLTAPGAATTLNGAGKLQFQFTVPDNAAFFRLQAQ